MAFPRFDPRQQQRGYQIRVNHRIRVPEVRVIAADGSMLGVLQTHEALRMALEQSLDLVEVNPKAEPPVCRGTAPGQWIEASGSVAILLPGPPHELKSMFA